MVGVVDGIGLLRVLRRKVLASNRKEAEVARSWFVVCLNRAESRGCVANLLWCEGDKEVNMAFDASRNR